MNTLEKNKVMSWMRKLARITNELNQMAFEMADFDGVEEKAALDVIPEVAFEPEVARASIGSMSIEDSQKSDESELGSGRTKRMPADKIANWEKQIALLDSGIKKAKTHEEAASLTRKRGVYSGHIRRVMEYTAPEKKGSVWKSRVK